MIVPHLVLSVFLRVGTIVSLNRQDILQQYFRESSYDDEDRKKK